MKRERFDKRQLVESQHAANAAVSFVVSCWYCLRRILVEHSGELFPRVRGGVIRFCSMQLDGKSLPPIDKESTISKIGFLPVVVHGDAATPEKKIEKGAFSVF